MLNHDILTQMSTCIQTRENERQYGPYGIGQCTRFPQEPHGSVFRLVEYLGEQTERLSSQQRKLLLECS